MSLHNKWFQLGASLVAMIMIANLQYAWTLFVPPMQQSMGWKLSDIQWGFTLFILFQTWIQPLEGWLIDRAGQRWFISMAGVLCASGWASIGFARTLPQMYAAYAVAGIGAALVYGASLGSALKWFRGKRGLASGIITAGFASGTALFMPVIARTIRTDGYRATFLWTGLLQGAVILIVAQFLRLPEREAATATAKPARAADRLGRHQFTTLEMLQTPHFYGLYAIFVAMTIGGMLVTAQAAPIARAWGLPAATLVLATTLSPLANGGGRIFWGYVSDHLGREGTMGVAFVLQAGCLLLVPTLGRSSDFWFVVTLMATYFTWGEIYALLPAALTDYFGTRHATSNNSVLYTSKGVASIVAGGLAARLFEQFGSWSFAFYGSAVLALLSAGMAVSLRRSAPLQTEDAIGQMVLVPVPVRTDDPPA